MFLFCSINARTQFSDQPGRTDMNPTALFRDFAALTVMAFAGYAFMLVS
jgi:hypothetical protein